jgi:DNA-binding MarR family transcriptional regulator
MLSDESQAALHQLFIRAGRYMGRGIHELGLSPGEARVLRTLHLQGNSKGMNPSSISTTLGVRQPTLTPIFNSLEKKGYIARQRDVGDRRRVRITLTDHGREDLTACLQQKHRLLSRVEECLTAEEIEQLIRILTKVDAFIQQERLKQEKEEYHAHPNPLP